jgi:uncharacterized protein YdaU (DUF1376 family)
MALRNQPYFPLYVQDFLTDEKLMECSVVAHGVYIRLLCVMHKSDEYGCILLRQKDRQSDRQIKNFALKLIKFMPFDIQQIENGLSELLTEGVINLEGDKIFQKRMVKDNSISILRSEVGKKGGKSLQSKLKSKVDFALAKDKAKTEYETEVDNEDIKNKKVRKQKIEIIELVFPFTSEKFMSRWSTLVLMPKWKKKSKEALQMSLMKLSDFDEEFSISLIENAISGDYQGLVFADTKEKFNNYKNKKNGTSNNSANGTSDATERLHRVNQLIYADRDARFNNNSSS